MSSLSARTGGGLYDKPLFHVADIKNTGVSAGYSTYPTPGAFDFTTIYQNEISGATMTTRNGSDVEVTSGVVGVHGRQDQSINNNTTTPLYNCYVTLPQGKYHFTIRFGEVTQYGSWFYNRTTDSLLRSRGATSNHYGTRLADWIWEDSFVLDSQYDLDIRCINGADDVAGGFGWANANTPSPNHLDLKIYKIG